MIEELKLAIKIDDASIEQSLLKQFANAQKMADKVVLDFKNVNFDDKQIEAKFKEMQKKAGQNPIDLSISGNTLDMLGQIDKRLTEIFSIGKGKSFIDSSSTVTDIGKIENKINELNKKYEEAQKKLLSIGSGNISGKDVNLVDNKEFQKLSQEVSELKNQFDDLKTHVQLLDDYTVPTDRFFKLQSQVETTTVKVSDLVEEFTKLSNAQKALSSTPQESNISLGDVSGNVVPDVEKAITVLDNYGRELDEVSSKILSTSKMMNTKGKLITLFHGSKTDFDNFDISSSDRHNNNFGQGAYFYDNPSNSVGYGGVSQWYANVEKIFIDGEKLSEAQLQIIYDKYKDKIKEIFNIDNLADFMSDVNKNVVGKLRTYSDMLGLSTDNDLLKSLGYDAILNKGYDVNEYIVLDENKIVKANSALKEQVALITDISEARNMENSNQDGFSRNMNKSVLDYYKQKNAEASSTIQSQEKIQEELKTTESQAEKTAQAIKEVSSTVSQNQTKDAFPKTSENLEQVAQSEQKVQQEAVATDKALDNISFTPNTEGFDDIIAKFGILREQAEQITKIVKTTKQTADGTPDISYKATLRNGSSYYLGENSTPQVLNASETVYDAKAVAKNAEQEAKAIQAEWDKNIKAIQDYMDAMTKLNNLKAKDKGTGSEANQIELQTQNVEKLKQVAWDARKNLSSMQAENPDIIAWKQWVDMMELFDQASKGSAESAAKLKDVLDNIKVPSLDKYENKLASYQTKKGAYNATIARFNDGGWTSDEYLKNVQAVKDAVKKYEDLLNNIKAKGGIASEDDVQNLKEYESEIKKTISTVTNMSASEKGYNFVSGQKELDKIHKLLNENSKMSAEAKAKIKAYYREIESGNPSMSLDRIHGEIMKIYNAEVEAGRAGRSFIDTLKNSGFHQIAAQMAGMFGVYDVINLGKQAFNTVKELDYALVDLKKTTAMNSSELEQFYYDSNDVAKQMGVTTKEIIDQASSWSRLGYNSKQAATEMAKLSSQFSLISPGMDTTTAQEGLVSIMKAWDIGYQDVKSQIMDDINALGNAMAEDNQDIVEGMERSAAALAAVGTSTKDAFALFSGIQEVLQNSEKSGTSLRSVALRLRSFDESTEEYSSDLANITGELADLTKTAEHAQGVSVFKPGSTTEFKNLVDYFREIADIWDEMSQKQQNDFLLKAFGRTQAQAGAALIQNFKGVEKALDVMDNAIGSSDKEMETAKQSITYKLNELKQTWVGTVQDIANRDDLGKIVDGLTDLSSAIGFVIDKLGLVGTVGLFGGAGTGIFKFIKNFDWVFKPHTKTLSNSFLVGQS